MEINHQTGVITFSSGAPISANSIPNMVGFIGNYGYSMPRRTRGPNSFDTVPLTLDRCYYYPIVPYNALLIENVKTHVLVAGTGTTIYANLYSDSSGLPGTKLETDLTIDTTTTGLKSVAANWILDGTKCYWIGFAEKGTTASSIRCQDERGYGRGHASSFNASEDFGLYEVLTGGWSALPASAAGSLTDETVYFPMLFLEPQTRR